jgi:hypothetical protein
MQPYGYVDVHYCQFCDWGYQKPTRVWGPLYFQKLKSRTCDGPTCPNLIVRSTKRTGHWRILGASPQDGAPRVPLDDKYRILEGVLSYVMGWSENPQTGFRKFRSRRQPGSPHHSPGLNPAQENKPIKKNGESHLGSQRTVPCVNKITVDMTHTLVMQRVSRLVGGYRPRCTLLGDQGICSTLCPVVYLPRMTPQSPLVEDPARPWPMGKDAKGRRSTPLPWKSRKPPPQPHFSKNNRIPVVQPKDGIPRQKDHPLPPSRTVQSSQIVPRHRGLNQSAPRFMNSVPLRQNPIKTSLHKSLRHSGKSTHNQWDQRVFELKEPIRGIDMYSDRYKTPPKKRRNSCKFQEKQTHIQRLRALNLHLPFSVYTEGQGLNDEDLGHVVNHVKGDWKHPEPPHRIKRASFIKGVLEARDPHDSPGVETTRQQLLEEFAGTVFQDRTGGNPPIWGPHGEAVIILKPGAVPVKQRMFQIHGERKVAWGKLVDHIIDDDKI